MTEPSDRDLDVALAVRDAIADDIERTATVFDGATNLGVELRAAIGAARGIAARIRAFDVGRVLTCE